MFPVYVGEQLPSFFEHDTLLFDLGGAPFVEHLVDNHEGFRLLGEPSSHGRIFGQGPISQPVDEGLMPVQLVSRRHLLVSVSRRSCLVVLFCFRLPDFIVGS
jgi:hypothetical protein